MSQENNWSETPGTQVNDFEPMKFSEIDIDEVFWINDNSNGSQNEIWRKSDNTTAFNLRGGVEKTFSSHDTVYMRV